jgi:translocation and assembly module TamB
MTSTQEDSKGRRRWARRLVFAGLVGLAVVIGLILALPWLIETPWVQRRLADAASRVLAPSAVRFDHLSVSWAHPTEIEGLVLRDAQGDDIVNSPRAHLSWSLRKILLSRPNPLTLTLERANLDIERFSDGKIDLLETLKPILNDEPDLTLLIRIVDGKLRFRSDGLDEPFLADKANINLDLNAFPQPIAWQMKLERAGESTTPGSVQIEGSMSRKRVDGVSPESLSLTVIGDHWPWAYSNPDMKAEGAFSGTVRAQAETGQVAIAGDARLLDLRVAGSALAGDEVRLDVVGLGLKVDRRDGSWTADRLDLTSSLGTIKASGSFPPADHRGGRVDGKIDLAALARQIPRTLRLRENLLVEKGAMELRAEVAGDPRGAGQTITATALLTDLTAKQGTQTLMFRDPATFTARIHRLADSLTLDQLDLQTPFLTATGRGDLDRGIDVSATVDLGAATQRIRQWVNLGPLELAGQGRIDAHYRRIANRIEAGVKSVFRGLKASGLPALQPVHRDKLEAVLGVKGEAAPSGFPSALHELSLTGHGDGEEIEARLSLDRVAKVANASAKGHTLVVLGGKKQQAEGALLVRWSEQDVTIDQLRLSLVPFVGPGGQFLPSDPLSWSGKGKYDITRDELTIAGDSRPPGGQARSLPVWPTKFRLGGLKARDAIWFDTVLQGDAAGMKLGSGTDTPRLAGPISGLIQGRQNQDGWDIEARAQVRDLVRVADQGARQALADEASASVHCKLARGLDRIDLSELAIVTPYGKLEGAGPVTSLGADPQVDLRGSLSPDWKVLSDLLARRVEPKASVSGSPRAWRLSGTFPRAGTGDLLASVNAELGVNLDQLDVFGIRLGRTAVVVRTRDGRVGIDPIDSTLNSGRLHLEPEVTTDKQGFAWLHLGSSSALHDAVVNDEVSHRVLMFAAPVLDQATRVRGRVSLALADAYFPITAGPDAQAKVDGDLLFDSVEFMPGPLADQIIGIFRQERRPLLVLRDPVSVRIIGRTIYQEGLIIPLGNLAAIGINGTVDFDQNLNLVASFAMAPPRKEIPVLSEILRNTQFQVPITGTFKKPRLNGDAIAARFKDMGLNMLDTVIGAGASGLGRILQRGGPAPRGGQSRDLFPPFVPPSPDQPPLPPQPGSQDPRNDRGSGDHPGRRAQPPPASPDDDLDQPAGPPGQLTPQERQLRREERKARRLEKRAERRLQRGLPPQ